MASNSQEDAGGSNPYLTLSAETRAHFDELFRNMQTEEHRMGADKTFALSGALLGEIALKAALKSEGGGI